MTWEEFYNLLPGALLGFIGLLLTYHAKGFVTEVKALRVALTENTHQTGRLVEQVQRLDKENETLRRSHDALTRFLISKGILAPPDPTTIND